MRGYQRRVHECDSINEVPVLAINRISNFLESLIFDFLPSILWAWRKLVHVLEKQSKRPDLLVVQRLLPRGHAAPTNAMLNFPKRHTFGIVFDALGRQLRRT